VGIEFVEGKKLDLSGLEPVFSEHLILDGWEFSDGENCLEYWSMPPSVSLVSQACVLHIAAFQETS
jgi:hypothetical protein